MTTNSEFIQEYIAQRNVDVVSRILKRHTNPKYEKAIENIYQAKDMLNRCQIMFPESKIKVTIEVEPIDLHLLEELMHDLKGICRDFTGILDCKNGMIIIKSIQLWTYH